VKLLLDENLPHGMRNELPGHEVFTTSYMGWTGIGNGELLRRAATAGFDVLITNDRGLEYQQNLGSLPVAVIVIIVKKNTIESIRPTFAELLGALSQILPGAFVKIVAS
jgi:hypothetical protein